MDRIKKTVGISKENTNIENIVNLLMLFNMIIIGGDRLSFKVGGMTIRLVQITLLITFALMFIERKVFLKKIWLFIPFLVANIISTVFSDYFKTGVTYIIWTIYNYVFVFSLFYSWCKSKSKEWIIDFWLVSFVIQGIYVVFQYIIGLNKINDPFFPMQVHLDVYRPAIWFYEPSYLATYFSVYLSMAFYLYLSTGKNKYLLNTIFSSFCLLIISSSLGYLSIVLIFGTGMVINILITRKLNIKRLLTSIGSFGCIFIILNFVDPNMFDVFLGRMIPGASHQSVVSDDDVVNRLENSSIGSASGGRITAWKDTLVVFKDNPIVGVGPNAYSQYTKGGFPPSNVTLEILANLGAIGFITFCIFILGIIISSIKSITRNEQMAIAVIFAIIIFGLVLQANQNYLRLYMWMHLGLLLSLSNQKEKEYIEQ